MNEIVLILVAIIGGASGLVGVIIGGKISSAAANRAARLEERRHLREIGLKVGLTNFEYCMKLAQSAADRYQQFMPVPPLKAFVIQGIKLMEIASDQNLSAQEMARRIAESEDFTQTIVRAAQERKKNDAS